MLNFLYAFDHNYNIQGCVSIFSLLENVNKKINIFVVLDDSNSSFEFPEKILNHKYLNNLKIKYIEIGSSFYNVDQSHVSQATFYRLYLQTLFEEETFDLVYLDSDIVCINNPIEDLEVAFNSMKNENYFVAFTDEFYRHENSEPLIRLNMSNDKYFNAGVMLVNLQEWKNNNYSVKANLLIQELKEKARFWDQDILNSLIDSNYYTLQNKLNFKTVGVGENRSLENVIFVHYSGKSKPWDAGGVFEEAALIYHKFFRQLFKNEFHIKVKNRRNALNKMFNYRSYYKFLKTGELIRYLVYSFIAILKK